MHILLIHTTADKPYLPRLKGELGSVGCSLFGEAVSTRTEILRLVFQDSAALSGDLEPHSLPCT